MDYTELMARLDTDKLRPLIEYLPKQFPATFIHGDLPGWLQALHALPELKPLSYEIGERVRIGEPSQCSDDERELLTRQLLALQPWRKGPFELFGLHLDTEWRSDWKWDRLKQHISPLQNRIVLDVGCGNGYHCWRMAGEGASLVVGADNHLLFVMQYWAIRHYLREPPVHVIPLALEELPEKLCAFDTVFSMGVIYHRRSPFDHLLDLKACLRPGGELILESLVIEGETGMSLLPQGRYARMPNVWQIPTTSTLESWLIRCGFHNVRLVDVNWTTAEEQRSTMWMNFESLPQALDSQDPRQTIEGYPAPRRAVFIAEKP